MWKEYQEEAASLFRMMGFAATVEATVEGARGVHNVDVWVVGSVHGIEFKWAVECKDWKVNVPKEKVLALLSLGQDTGADRGFLLSEVGFQSGAIRTAQKTNVTLTSIADLREAVREGVVEATAAKINWRLTRVKDRLLGLHKQTGDYMSEFMRPMGKIFFLDLALKEALDGEFPVIYAVEDNEQRLKAADWDDFVEKATELLNQAEAYASKAMVANANWTQEPAPNPAARADC